MKKRLLIIMILIILYLPVLASNTQDKILLRFSPSVGERLTYKLNSVIESRSGSLLGDSTSLGASASGDLTMVVNRVTADSVHVDLMSTDLLITLQSPVNTRSIDLSTQESNSLKVVFDRAGKVNEIKNMNALKRKTVLNFSIIQIIRNYFPNFPTRAISIGDTWTDNRKMTVPFQGMQLEVLLSVKYTLDSIQFSQTGPEASISAAYTVLLKGKKKFDKGDAIFDGSGNGTGQLYFLVNKGYFSDYRLQYKIDSTMKVRDKGNVVMRLPVAIDVDASLELVR